MRHVYVMGLGVYGQNKGTNSRFSKLMQLGGLTVSSLWEVEGEENLHFDIS